MKHILLAVLVLLGLAAEAQNTKAQLSFEKKVHDFGSIKEEGGPVAYTFEFTNTGQMPLVIHNVRASCGCTTPEWTRTPIQPGGKGTLKATFDPRNRPGNFNKSITVSSNGQNATEILRIVGRVEERERTVADNYPREMGEIRLKSAHLSFTRVEPGSQKEATLGIINTSSQAVTLSFNRVPSHLRIAAQPATLQPGQEGTIKATYDASKVDDWGFVVDQVYVLVNGNQPKDNRLSVSATIEEDYSSWSPQQLANAPDIQFSENNFDFGAVKQGTVLEHTFKITNKGKSDLILRKVRTSCGCTASKPDKEVVRPGETVNLAVSFNTRGRNGRQSQSVTIYSNDPKKSTMLLRVSATVNP